MFTGGNITCLMIPTVWSQLFSGMCALEQCSREKVFIHPIGVCVKATAQWWLPVVILIHSKKEDDEISTLMCRCKYKFIGFKDLNWQNCKRVDVTKLWKSSNLFLFRATRHWAKKEKLIQHLDFLKANIARNPQNLAT